ncbi:MAG: DUF4296 domain-containing protein [Chitinophagales bacterium]|nr:DUF4296 domain-containing protein [Chitinophagales bacterium]
MVRTIIYLSFAAIIFSFGIISCNKKSGAPPKDLIAKDKMIDLLVDVHLAEASTEIRSITPQLIDYITAKRYQMVFDKYKITLVQFVDSYNYYLEHTDVLDEIYVEVVNRLSAIDGRISSRQRKTLNSRDSILTPPPLPRSNAESKK